MSLRFDLGPRRRGRRAGLTAMIDVVFLLLVFFMLAARFGLEGQMPLQLSGTEAQAPAWQGPPRLIDVLPEGQRLNGVAMEMPALLAALPELVADSDGTVLLRPREGAALQRLVAVIEALQAAGHARLVVVE